MRPNEVAEPHFHGRCHIVLNNDDVEPALRKSIMKMFNSFTKYQRVGSNWVLYKVLGVANHIVQYNPLKGSSYLPLPAKLASKKHCQRLECRWKMLHVVGISCSLPSDKSSRKSCELCATFRKARLRRHSISCLGRRHSQIREEKRYFYQSIWLWKIRIISPSDNRKRIKSCRFPSS